MIDISALKPFVDWVQTKKNLEMLPDVKPHLYWSGYLGNTIFVLTLDLDGHIEVSLSRVKGHGRLTYRMVEAFFKKLRLQVPREGCQPILKGNGLFWVIPAGRGVPIA